MSRFEDAYDEYYQIAARHDGLIETKEKISLHLVVEKQKVAVDLYYRKLQESKISYEEQISFDLLEAADRRDFIKIKFLLLVIVKYPISYLIQGLIYTFNVLLEDYLDFASRSRIVPHVYVIEQIIDVLIDYPDSQLLPVISKLCQIDPPEKEYSDIVGCIVKSFLILGQIHTKESYDIVSSCLTNSHIEVREEAECQLQTWQDEGLVDSNGKWVKR